MLHKNYGCKSVLGYALLAATTAYADTSADQWLPDGHVSGDIRVYDFSRDYGNSSKLSNLHSFSLGGKLKVETSSSDGMGAALGVYFAQDIGLNNHDQNNKYINPLLMGTGYGIYTLGEAYVQYQKPEFLARVGNQSIDNPWINPGDGFMIPNLYQGVTVAVTPIEGLKFESDRVLSFKNRTVSGFENSNLFALPYDNPQFTGSNNGAFAFGATYKNDHANIKTWLYNFYDFAKMSYMEGGYKFPMGGVAPFVDFEYMRETGSGSQYLGAVDSRLYGARVGSTLPDQLGKVYFAYDTIPYNNAAGISNGNLLSPYTQVYNTDPLFTTVMNYGLVSARGAGHAWLVGMTLKPLEDRLDIIPTISRYNTAPYTVANVNAFMLDIAYHLGGSLKGISIRNRLGIEQGIPLWGGNYVDERIMLQYVF